MKQWTKPYFGVSHLGEFSLKSKWATVEDYGSFATLSRWFPGCGFSPLFSNHDDAAQAKRLAEQWLDD